VTSTHTGLPAPPEQLVHDGVVALGRWSGPVARTNLLDAPYRGWPRPLRWLRLKEWQAVQIATPRLFVNLALFDAKLLTLLQVKVYDRVRAVKHVHERKLRPGAFRLSDQLLSSRVAYRDRTSALAFDNQLGTGVIDITLEAAATKSNPALSGRMRIAIDRGAAQVVNLPFVHGSIYSHKGLFPISGHLTIAGDHHDLAADGAVALIDDHKAYYPYVMRYDWVTSACRGADGRARAFNLTRNQCRDPERWNENCAWIDDQIGALPAVRFTRERERQAGELWRVRDTDGRVDLVFEPTVAGDVAMNVGVVESRYRGPFGRFHGRLEPVGLSAIVVDDWFGMGEDFWLRC
jgi:Protein of unknown function (DUF2804)